MKRNSKIYIIFFAVGGFLTNCQQIVSTAQIKNNMEVTNSATSILSTSFANWNCSTKSNVRCICFREDSGWFPKEKFHFIENYFLDTPSLESISLCYKTAIEQDPHNSY